MIVQLSHKEYINKVLETFRMDRCSVNTVPIQKRDKFILLQCVSRHLTNDFQAADLKHEDLICDSLVSKKRQNINELKHK